VRSGIYLLELDGTAGTRAEAAADELVLLPAAVIPNSVAPDPTGRWLALVTQAATAPGGNTNLLNLCVLELRPDGLFRDIADLGAGGTPPATAPVAWPPAGGDSSDRLSFVGPAPATSSGNGGGLF